MENLELYRSRNFCAEVFIVSKLWEEFEIQENKIIYNHKVSFISTTLSQYSGHFNWISKHLSRGNVFCFCFFFLTTTLSYKINFGALVSYRKKIGFTILKPHTHKSDLVGHKCLNH